MKPMTARRLPPAGLALFLTFVAAPASAACNIPGVRVSIEATEWFMRRPSQLLDRYPRGEEGLVSESLAFATRPATLQLLIDASRTATTQQRRAIGEGMARAAFLCQRFDNGVARSIVELVDAAGDSELRTSFRRTYNARGGLPPAPATAAGPVQELRPRTPGSLSDLYGDDRRSPLGMPSIRGGGPTEIMPIPNMADPPQPVR